MRFALSYPKALECALLVSEERFACFKGYIFKYEQTAGILPAQEFIFFAEKEGIITNNECHNLGHALGDKIIRDGASAEEALETFLPLCTNGYAHGAIYALLNNKVGHDTRSTPEDIAAICLSKKDPASGGCLHGLGHSLVSLYGNNIFSALDLCDKIKNSDQHDRDNCYDGAFMENVFDFYSWRFEENSPKDHYRKKDDPTFPCNAIEEQYRLRCYFMNTAIATVASYKRGYVKHLSDIGDQVPREYAHGFWYGVGRASNTIFHGDQQVVIDTCSSVIFPAQDLCFGGAAQQIMLVDGGNLTRAEEFCALLPEESVKRCLGILHMKVDDYPRKILPALAEYKDAL